MKRTMRRVTATFLVTGILLLPSTHAAAAPEHVTQDATQNRLAFDYDASSGTITSRSSFRRASRDEVRFEIGIVESDGYGAGLTGKLRLRLEGDAAVTYDGWFEITITDDSGDVVFRQSRPATIQLKPRPGCRKDALTYKVDLPSGSYEASGIFEQEA